VAFPQTAFAVVSYAVPGLSVIHSLVVSIWQPWVCAIYGAHLLGSTACIQRGIYSDYFFSCKLCCCMAKCVILLCLNMQSDIFPVMIAWL